ncbi:ATP-binding protein [Defluviimonas sp. WL0002]|uniref:histidine kinase n=1 Tax=Albidovulum marisflavi TaxID=2984159 RepID=A0ABT2ZFE9_9RHOB|nr:ATP-binding protein [Defluviimonas sp. WL0002]MCV2869849.1 ATP-binding protein [Defluviimonas sp. WL0002]
MNRRLMLIPAYVLASALLAYGVWLHAYAGELSRLADRGQADLVLAGDRLTGELRRYRELAVLLADHPAILARAEGEGDQDAVEALFLRSADKTGAMDISLVAPGGRVLAASTGVAAYRAPYVGRAFQGALGFSHAVDAGQGRRAFAYAAPVHAEGRIPAAVVVRIGTERVEATWRGDPLTVFFTDDENVVFVASREELVLRRRTAGGGSPPGYPEGALRDFIPHETRVVAGYEIWNLQGGPYLPAEAIHLARPFPVVELVAEALIDTAPAWRQATLLSFVAGAVALGLGAVVFALVERRRALALKLAAEAEANAKLEARVEERTRALSEANQQLRQTQAELVQAGKLSALGQMSAGISHELNQPLMAIRSYAENAGLFLQREEPARAADNLARISELARRMGRIIKNLRAFARQESEAIGNVDLVGVVDAALELTEAKLRGAGVALHWQPPAQSVMVRGGEVRLQQVAVNLLSNAADALQGQPDGVISIGIVRDGGRIRLSVADNGPGIVEPERIFDPFYSTKEVGHSEGMGLGLSISYGIVHSFGGAIAGRNRAEGGAEFTVELDAAEVEVAA